jgi:hypothetical protein
MNHVQITQTQKNLIILDIDGCLVDSEERLPHFLNGDRETYDNLYHTDKTIPAGHVVYGMFLDMVRDTQSLEYLFVTGRSELCREYTTLQLQELFGFQIDQSKLLMRPLDSEKEHDTVLKPRLIEEAGYSLDRILLVIEDRDSTVAMWRERGITCWQTQPGPF